MCYINFRCYQQQIEINMSIMYNILIPIATVNLCLLRFETCEKTPLTSPSPRLCTIWVLLKLRV